MAIDSGTPFDQINFGGVVETPEAPTTIAPAPPAGPTLPAPHIPGASPAPIPVPNDGTPSFEFPIETPEVPTEVTPAPDGPPYIIPPGLDSGKEITLRGRDIPREMVIGKVRKTGVLRFITTDVFEDNGDEVISEGQFLHMVVCMAGHRCEAFDELYLDKRQVVFNGNPPGGVGPDARWSSGYHVNLGNFGVVFWSHSLGDKTQAANVDLVSQSSVLFPTLWSTNHRLRGIAYIYFIMQFTPVVFQNGFPLIEVVMRGKNTIHDPRTHAQDANGNPLESGYSNNAALAIADFLIDKDIGLKADYATEIDNANLIEAANICDEQVDYDNPGPTENRYEINGVFSTADSPRQTLEKFKRAIAGDIVNMGGKWRIYPGDWRAPIQINSSDLVLTDSDLRSDMVVHTKPTGAFNGVKGTFIDKDDDYKVKNYPAATSSVYVDQDNGEENWLELNFPFAMSQYTSTRIATLVLKRHREFVRVEATYSLKAYPATVADVLKVTNTLFGFSEKEFEVRFSELVMLASGAVPVPGVRLILQETGSAIYDDDLTALTETTVPNTTLPQPTDTEQPSGFTVTTGTNELLKQGDGTVVSRAKLTWNAINHIFVNVTGKIEIQYKKSALSDWQEWSPVGGSQSVAWISDVHDGVNYDFRIRSVNSFGHASDWTTATGIEIIGKTAAPEDVTGLSAMVQGESVEIQWNGVSDIDLQHYELRYGVVSASPTWETATLIDRAVGQRFSWRRQVAETYRIYIKAVDTTGNPSDTAASADVTISAPSAPGGTSFTFDGDELILDWDEANAQFDVKDYELRHGSTYGSSTFIAYVDASEHRFRPNGWSGLRNYWIAARDVAGNLGSAAQIAVTIATPSVPQTVGFTVIRHNVELRWAAPATTSLPVKEFEIRKGDDFASATVKGKVTGTFFQLVEAVASSPTYRYWIVGIDSAGNYGTETSVDVAVSNPPDFVLQADHTVDWDSGADLDSESNVVIQTAFQSIIGPVVHESWDDHFNVPAWDDIQDKIDAGYDKFLEPANTADGTAVAIVNFGTSIPAQTLITLQDRVMKVNDEAATNASIQRDIAHSTSASGPWTETTDTQAALSNAAFQYVRIRYTFINTDDKALLEVDSVRVQLSVTEEEETANSSTSSGSVTYNIQKNFIDVKSIQLTPRGASGDTIFIFHDFDYSATPQASSFTVYTKDKDGNNVDKDFGVSIKGVVSTA